MLIKLKSPFAWITQTTLGDDSFSRKMLEQWLAEGIQVSFVRQISTNLPRFINHSIINLIINHSRLHVNYLKLRRVIVCLNHC